MAQQHALPLLKQGHDNLKDGLPSYKADLQEGHPLQAQPTMEVQRQQRDMLRSLYGSSLVQQLDIEREITTNVQRFPDLPPSMLGWEVLNGTIEDFGPSDYLNPPGESSKETISVHQEFERKLKLTKLGQGEEAS